MGELRTTPLAGSIGAEVHDVRLDELDDDGFAELCAAFWEHQVLVLRDQHLDPADHKAFGERFGELHSHPAAAGVDGHPEILLLRNRGKDKNITQVWHSDVSCEERPPSISILQAKELPPAGGDTMWADQYGAYERLSFVWSRASQPDLTVRHRWSVGDIVMWDNRCVMHYAIHDYDDEAREMHRVTLRGQVPVR